MFQHWNFVFLFVKKQNKRKTQKIGFKKPTAYIYTYRGYGLDFFLSRPIAWARRRARIFASRELPYRSSTNHYALHEMHARPQLICPLGLHPISPMFRHRTRKLPNNGRFFFFAFEIGHLEVTHRYWELPLTPSNSDERNSAVSKKKTNKSKNSWR